MATAFLDAGIHVICDKPLTLREGLALVKRQQWLFAVTHAYNGYLIVRHARALVTAGKLLCVQVECLQD